jgi:hypothetical protein
VNETERNRCLRSATTACAAARSPSSEGAYNSSSGPGSGGPAGALAAGMTNSLRVRRIEDLRSAKRRGRAGRGPAAIECFLEICFSEDIASTRTRLYMRLAGPYWMFDISEAMRCAAFGFLVLVPAATVDGADGRGLRVFKPR